MNALHFNDFVFYGPLAGLASLICISIWYFVRYPHLSKWSPTSWGIASMLLSVPIFSVCYALYIQRSSEGPLWYSYSLIGWPILSCLVALLAFVLGDIVSWMSISLLSRTKLYQRRKISRSSKSKTAKPFLSLLSLFVAMPYMVFGGELPLIDDREALRNECEILITQHTMRTASNSPFISWSSEVESSDWPNSIRVLHPKAVDVSKDSVMICLTTGMIEMASGYIVTSTNTPVFSDVGETWTRRASLMLRKVGIGIYEFQGSSRPGKSRNGSGKSRNGSGLDIRQSD